ncbi:MAG: hypothetical protein ABII97_01210 [Patescibacteria group bacterium]
MPYLVPEIRPKYKAVLDLMILHRALVMNNLISLLFSYCKEHVEASYNNYKNFRSDAIECAKEIERRMHEFVHPDLRGFPENTSESWTKVCPEILKAMKNAEVVGNGDLNYILFYFCRYYVLAPSGFVAKLWDAWEKMGRIIAPYEDKKIIENGDV